MTYQGWLTIDPPILEPGSSFSVYDQRRVPMKHLPTRLLFLAIGSLIGLSGVIPAGACACGVVVAREGSLTVSRERAIVRFQGRMQDLILALDLDGAAKDAALIVPVPAQPELGESPEDAFEQLEQLTRPDLRERVVRRPPSAAGPATEPPTGTELIERRTVGNLDVTVVQTTDGLDLRRWLADNQFEVPPRTMGLLDDYIRAGWFFAVARLAPDAPGKQTNLRLSFEADQPVYPLRLNQVAPAPVDVRVYVIAAHRMYVPGFETEYAGEHDLAAELPALGWTERAWITRLSAYRLAPSPALADLEFTPSPTDTPFRLVVERVRYETDVTPVVGTFTAIALLSIGFIVFGLIVIGGVILGAIYLGRRQKRL